MWENYAPEYVKPGKKAKKDFVGWSALGPIALLIESVIGIDVDAPTNTITWNIHRTDVHGVDNLRFQKENISLLYDPNRGNPVISVDSEVGFRLVIAHQGIETLIEQFEKIRDQEVRLVVVGQPTSADYESLIREKTTSDSRIQLVMRRVSDDEMQEFFNAADVVVLPFERILTSGSAILAMGFSKPVIAPRSGALPEIFDGTPLLYENGELGGSLDWATANKSQLNQIGQKNRERVNDWTWGRLAEECLA